MGFALVLAYMLASAAIAGVISGLILLKFHSNRGSFAGISLIWWLYVVIWWSGIAGPSELTPKNVQVLSAPAIYYSWLFALFVGAWMSTTDLLGQVNVRGLPKGKKSAVILLSLFTAGFFFTRRISASVILVTAALIALTLLVALRDWQMPSKGVMGFAISALLVFILAALFSGFAHEIKPVAPVPPDQDEVFYWEPIRRYGWYYFFAALIVILTILSGALTKSFVVGVITFVGLYALFALIVLVTQLINAFALITPLIDAIPGLDVSQWISDLGKVFQLPSETVEALQALANPEVEITGAVPIEWSVDEQGYFEWPWEVQ